MSVIEKLPIGLEDVERAAGRIAGEAVRTPLLTAPVLDDLVGARVFIKPECLQRTGSFKFRGAYNRIAMMSPEERSRGIVAASSGNHAQGVAEAARLFGVPSTIVMPSDAPAVKRARTERSGATVVSYDRAREDRVAIAMKIVARTGATFVAPYDDPGVMAGQGTIGLEIAQDLLALGAPAPTVLVPVSGGGLMSGIATAMAALLPGTVVQPVEPENFDDHTRSLQAGERLGNRERSGSLADALMAETPGEITFEVNRRLASPGYAVADRPLLAAIAFAAREFKLVTEPGGVIALAALMENRAAFAGKTVVVVLSGGNVDDALLAEALRQTA